MKIQGINLEKVKGILLENLEKLIKHLTLVTNTIYARKLKEIIKQKQ
jgi:hypothetical protein